MIPNPYSGKKLVRVALVYSIPIFSSNITIFYLNCIANRDFRTFQFPAAFDADGGGLGLGGWGWVGRGLGVGSVGGVGGQEPSM